MRKPRPIRVHAARDARGVATRIGAAGVLLVMGALAACAHVTPIRHSDGKPAALIGCGTAQPWSVCYEKADEICPNGYDVLVEKQGFKGKTLTVRCKEASTPSASPPPS